MESEKLSMENMVKKFWEGQITLWKSYWLIGELINSLVLLLIYNIEIKLLENIDLYKQLPFLNLTSFSFMSKFSLLIWTIFITVGIWRSAENYNGSFIIILLTLTYLSFNNILPTLKFIFLISGGSWSTLMVDIKNRKQ